MTHMTRMTAQFDLEITRRSASGESYAVATVVRTLSSTAAKPGDRALLDMNGELIAGFLGGGCVRAAVGRAARDAIASGQPALLSVRPEDLLQAEGLAAGQERDGVRYARNGCPSRGSLDVFVEPVLPRPHMVICGDSAVALALADLSARFDFHRTLIVPAGADKALPPVEVITDDMADAAAWGHAPFVVIATMGKGDEAALRRALDAKPRHIAFVGSRRKFASLRSKLETAGFESDVLNRVEAPAGVDIHAVTPDEIALSILARLVMLRRQNSRSDAQ